MRRPVQDLLIQLNKTHRMNRLTTTLLALLIPFLSFAQVVDPEPGYMTADGPYIFYQDGGTTRTVEVGLDGEITETEGETPASVHVTSHDGQFSFDVPIHHVEREPWSLPSSGRTFVLSDPHGRMDCLVSILKASGVVDEDLNWSFGADRVVLIGDIMDRGDDVTQILWLVYKLEAEAMAAGGSMSFVYGNHEAMVLAGDLRYCREKYKELAERLGMNVPDLYGPDTELGRWLSTRNTIMRVGDDIFVHAGLSRQMLELGMDIPEINSMCSEAIFLSSKEKKALSDTTYMLFRSAGPVWYRGFFLHKKEYGGKMDKVTLDRILDCHDGSRIFVGHTIFRNVRSFYRGKVIAVDVDAKVNHDSGRSRAVLIEGEDIFAVYDTGFKRILK